ncbi:hypothetical protein [Desulfosporosinus sp. SB140]|uniref:hypothetical protein n=1 Tax=Desulfosporosinus paludis TaxID=3115649 RepID=UPI0038908FC7
MTFSKVPHNRDGWHFVIILAILWRLWVKASQENEKQTKLDLAKQMLLEVRQANNARLWVAMDRWYLCKKFLKWLIDERFDWVTKAKRNTVPCGYLPWQLAIYQCNYPQRGHD